MESLIYRILMDEADAVDHGEIIVDVLRASSKLCDRPNISYISSLICTSPLRSSSLFLESSKWKAQSRWKTYCETSDCVVLGYS